MGQKSRTCGAKESHLWGKRVAPVWQKSRTCGAKESHLWGKRVAPVGVGQKSRITALVGARASPPRLLKKQIFRYLNIKLSPSMNGSNVWCSLAFYGDVLSLFKWNIYKTRSIFLQKLS